MLIGRLDKGFPLVRLADLEVDIPRVLVGKHLLKAAKRRMNGFRVAMLVHMRAMLSSNMLKNHE